MLLEGFVARGRVLDKSNRLDQKNQKKISIFDKSNKNSF